MDKSVTHRFQVLDSLRGICACMVVMYHFHTVGWISNLPLMRNSWLFVDFFFVLSGFVITTAYRQRIANGFSAGSFMWLRMGRIYPVHLAVTAMFVLVQLVLMVKIGSSAFQGSKSLATLLGSLTLTQTFLLPTAAVWNGPSWSIAVEMWTYLIFAGLFRAARSRLALIAVCLGVISVSCAYIVVFQGGRMDTFQFGGFVRCTYGFSLGVIGAVIYPAIRMKWGSATTALELVAVAAVVAFLSVGDAAPFAMAAPPIFLVAILIFANEGGWISFSLKTKFPLLLGQLSYTIYMVHLFILYRLTGIIQLINKDAAHPLLVCGSTYSCPASGSPLLADALIVPVFAVVIVGAYAVRKFIEVPCEQWAKDVLYKRRPVIAVGALRFGHLPEPTV